MMAHTFWTRDDEPLDMVYAVPSDGDIVLLKTGVGHQYVVHTFSSVLDGRAKHWSADDGQTESKLAGLLGRVVTDVRSVAADLPKIRLRFDWGDS